MSKCPNKSHPLYKKLVNALGENLTYQAYYMNDYNLPDYTEHPMYEGLMTNLSEVDTIRTIFNLENKAPEVNYLLKATQILQSDKAEQTFAKGEKNNWDMKKILTKLQVPKEQKQIILDTGLTDLSEIVTELATNYSFTVETVLALDKHGPDPLGNYVIMQNTDGTWTVDGEYDGRTDFQTEAAAEAWVKGMDDFKEPSKRYTDLTVGGGNQYQEQRVVTPGIKPRVEGHASFSEANDIGWFRSDSLIDHEYTDFDKKIIKQLKKKRGKNPEYFADNERFEPSKTRRLLEFQSDLFQQRVHADGVMIQGEITSFDEKTFTYTPNTGIGEIQLQSRNKNGKVALFENRDGEWFPLKNTSNHFRNRSDLQDFKKFVAKEINLQKKSDKAENKFLQLLAAKNNWKTFFIKSFLQDSVKQGYEKVLIPKGETIAKIEGQVTRERFIQELQDQVDEIENITDQSDLVLNRKIKSNDILIEGSPTEVKDKNDFNGKGRDRYDDYIPAPDGYRLIAEDGTLYFEYADTGEYAKVEDGEQIFISSEEFSKVTFKGVPEPSVKATLEYSKNKLEFAKNADYAIFNKVWGIYEHTVTDILNKQVGKDRVKPFTDVYGNEWNEVTLDQQEDASPILFRLTDAVPVNNDTVDYLDLNRPVKKDNNTFVSSTPNERKNAKDTRFLKERFPDASVDFYQGVKHVGSQVAHGYMKGAAFHIWNNAEVGTAYHEAFHGLTQMYFTDAKRSSLYDVAAEEFGMDRSNELAIEEQLAENFRDYMLMQENASIPTRIKQFFKSLYYYVKALVTDSTSMDQAYTMLETGRIPQKLKRNMDRFKPDTALYSLRPNVDAWMQKDLIDGIYDIYQSRREINEARNADQKKPEKDVLDEVRKYFLTHAFSGENGLPVREARAMELMHLKKEDPAKFQEKLDEYEYWDEPSDEALQYLPYSAEKAAEVQNWYLDIASQWETQESDKTDNFVEPGWKDIFIEALPEYGYEYSEYQVEHIGSEDVQERIYDRSSLEESMKDKLSGRVRQFIKSINDGSGFTHIGLKRKVEPTKAYTDILQEVHNAEGYTEMVKNLKDASVYKPYLRWVAIELENSDKNLKTQFAVNFRQHYTDFMIMKQYQNAVALFSANQNNMTTKIIDSWKADAFRDKRTSKNNLYIVELDDDGTRNYTLNTKVAEQIEAPLERLYTFNATKDAPVTDAVIEDFTTVLKSLSLFQGTDLTPMLKTHIEQGVLIGKKKYAGRDLIRHFMFPTAKNDSSIAQLIGNIADFKYNIRENKFDKFQLKEVPDSYFESRNNIQLLHQLADVQKKQMTDIVQSFLNADKKTIYPYNMATQLSDVINKLKRREFFGDHFLFDPNYNPMENAEYQAPLFKMLKNSKLLTNELELKKFDALQDKNDNEGITYREQSEKTAKVARIHGFLNDGDGTYSYFPLPTQADRDFFAMIRLPRVNAWKNFGLADMSVRKVVRNELFSQIKRYQEAKQVIKEESSENWIPSYHYKIVNGKVDSSAGNAFKLTGLLEGLGWKMIDNTNIKDINLEDYENNSLEGVTKEQVDALIGTYAEEFNNKVTEGADAKYQELLDLQVISNDNGKLLNRSGKVVKNDFSAQHPFGKKINHYKSFIDMLRQYELNARIMKNEMIKIFYQNRDFFKDYDDFSKRAGLLTTPGLKPTVKGDVAKDWGLSKNITEIIINDTYNINNEDTSLYKWLKAKGFDWADEYKKGASNKSDAQGYMSIDAYREWQQAFGEWTDQHEEAYINYKGGYRFQTADGFVPSILPIKPSVLGPMPHTVGSSTMVAPVSIKNSYMVLLREFTQEDGSPLRYFDNLRQRMEVEGEYTDKNLEPIHWVNTESTHKILKTNIVNLDTTPDLSNVVTHQIPADIVRVPQVKPEKKSKQLLLGSQTLRLLVSVINSNIEGNYELATGESLTRGEWIKAYHDVISDMVNTSITDLRTEIGYAGEGEVETDEQQLNMLKNVREMLVNQAKESNRPMPDNQRKGLDIEKRAEGYRYSVPLAFPAFSRKNEQMLFSIFRNNLIQQKIQGKQVVQAAEIGDATATGPLNFITLDGEKASKGQIGNIKKAEVAISSDVADMLGIKEGDDLSKLPDSVKSLLGYRIPTSGKNLMLPMVIKRILPPNYKATIVVPGQITTQMGSDFDVDSLMLFVPHNNKDEDTLSRLKYDAKNPTREMKENRFMELMEAVLTHPEHLQEIVQPLEGQTLEKRAEIERKNDPVLDPNDPNTDVEYQIRNRDGKAGIGIYSNALMGYVTSQAMNLEISESLVVKKNGKTHILNDLSPIRDIEGISVEDNIRQHQISAIDNAKTPIMKALNDNAITSSSTIFLLTSGLDLNSIVDFRTHPAIKRLVREYENREAKPYELSDIAEELFPGVNDYEIITDNDLDFDDLNRYGDVHLISKFIEFTKAGREFTKLSNILTPNRISDMSSNAALAEYQNQVDYINGKKFDTYIIPEIEGMNKVEVLDELYPMNKAYRSAITESINFSKKFFPYHTNPIKEFKHDLMNLTGRDALNKDVHNKFHDFLFTYMLSIPNQTGDTFFDGEYVRELLTGEDNLVKKVMDLKVEDGHFADNLFISSVTESKHNVDNEVKMFDFNTAVDYDKAQVDVYSDAFMQLYNNPRYRDIAVDLMNYSIFTTGFSPAPNNFMQMIPIEMWKNEELGYMKTFYEQLNIFKEHQDVEDYGNLVHDFVLHNVQTKGLLHSMPLEKGEHKNEKLNVNVNEARERGLLGEDNQIKKYVRAYNPDSKDFDLWVFRDRTKNLDTGKVTYEYLKSGQKGQDYRLIEPNFEINKVGAFPNSILASNRRRNKTGGTYKPLGYTQRHRSTRVEGTPRKNTLQETFSKAGINVTIKIDNSIDSLGKVDIGSDGVTITMKSEDLRGADTEIHEFGHIYIEALGYKSEIVQQGIEQLRDGKLWNEVKKLYPELSQESLEKEVLVTAIGEQGADYLNQPWWKAWWNRMLNKVKELFGIERNIAQQLAQEMLANDLRPLNTSQFVFDRTFRHRKAKKFEASRNRVNDMVLNLEKQIQQIRQLAKDPTKSTQAKVNLQKMLQRRLEESFNIQEEVQSVQDFVQHANTDFATLETQIEQLRFGDKTSDFMSKAGQMIQLVEHYQILDDIKKSSKDVLDSTDNGPTMELLQHTIDLRDRVKEGLNDVVIPVMAEELSAKAHPQIEKAVNEMIEQIDTGYIPNERAIKKTSEYKNIQANTALSDAERQEQIQELAKRQLRQRIPNAQNIQTMLRRASKGDNYYLWMVDPVIYSDDQAIQLFTLMVKDKLADARRDTLNWRERYDKIYNKFVNKTGLDKWNNESNNERVLEDVTYSTKRNGEWVTIKRKSFVQPYDVDKFNMSRYKLYQGLHKKFAIPEDPDLFQEWKESNPQKYRSYKKEAEQWYRKHTTPIEGWESIRDENWGKLNELILESQNLDKELAEGKITEEQHSHKKDAMTQEQIRLENWFESNFSDSQYKKPMNELSRPAKGEGVGKANYTNAKYEWLQRPENSAYKEYHDELMESYKELQDIYGKFNFQMNKWDDYSYYVPSVRKNDKDRLIENGIKDSAIEFKRDLTILDTDDIYGQYVDTQKKIPIYYANAVDAKDVSNDIASSMLLFAKQAMEYTQLTDALGHVYVMRNILENREIPKVDGKGNSMLDSVASKIGINRTVKSEIPASQTKHFKQWESWVDQIFFGVKSEKHEVGNFELNKVITATNTYSAFNVFPLNFLQGAANIFIGNTYILQEAVAGEHFTKGDYAKAQSMFTRAIPGLLNDIGRTIPVSKLGQLIDTFDVQEGMTMANISKNVFNNRLKNMTTAEQAMFLQRSGELQMAITPFLAIMHNTKVKGKSGEEISLYDAYHIGKDGKIALKDGITLTKEQQNDITNKVNAINRSLQGVYDAFNANHLKKKWYGKAMLLFRSWLLPTYRRFWGYNDADFRLDHEMGSVREGIYRTGIRFFGRALKGADRFSMDAYKKMNEVEKRNVKKMIVHMGMILVTFGMIGALKMREEDEELTQAEYYGLYYSHRLRSELMIFLNPVTEGQKLLRSPAANTMMITKLNKFLVTLVGDVGRTLTGEELAEYERSIGVKEKGDSKLYWRMRDLIPGFNSLDNSKSPEEAYKWYTELF